MFYHALPFAMRAFFVVLLGLVLLLIWDQYYWWQLKDEYAFGFIVPLFVAFIVYERWPRWLAILQSAGQTEDGETTEPVWQRRVNLLLHWVSLLMMLGGMGFVLLGALYRALEGQNLITSNLFAVGFANILLGGVFFYVESNADGKPLTLRARWQFAALFLFPAVIWMLSVPMFDAVHRMISTFLMNKVAVVVFHSFDILGFAIVQEGSVLKLPRGDVGVEDACSGIRSLMACLFAGSFLGAVYFDSLWKKTFLVGTAMLFAFINNIFRSLFLTAWAYAKGPTGLDAHVYFLGMDLGNVHDFTGWVVLGLTVVCLLILVKLFSLEWETPAEPESSEQAAADN